MLEGLALSVGLAMDATAVTAARAVAGDASRSRLLALATSCGLFQAAMAAGGWLIGDRAIKVVARWDHWIAFVLLGVLGTKMVLDHRSGEQPGPGDGLGFRTILVISVATSIDALAAGVTIPALATPPAATIGMIGLVTFLLCALAAAVGRRMAAGLRGRLELIGGLALMAIGAKILIEHLVA